MKIKYKILKEKKMLKLIKNKSNDKLQFHCPNKLNNRLEKVWRNLLYKNCKESSCVPDTCMS